MLVRHHGRVYALHDRCPHGGVPLSAGRWRLPGHDHLRLPRLDLRPGDGRLMAVLTDGPDSPIRGKANVRGRTRSRSARAGLGVVGEVRRPPVEADIPDDLLHADAVIEGLIRRGRATGAMRSRTASTRGTRSTCTRRRRGPGSPSSRPGPAACACSPARMASGWSACARSRSSRTRMKASAAGRPSTSGSARVGQRRPRCGCVCPPPSGWARAAVGWTTRSSCRWTTTTTARSCCRSSMRGLSALLFRLRYWLYIRWLYRGLLGNQDQWMIELMQTPPERLYRRTWPSAAGGAGARTMPAARPRRRPRRPRPARRTADAPPADGRAAPSAADSEARWRRLAVIGQVVCRAVRPASAVTREVPYVASTGRAARHRFRPDVRRAGHRHVPGGSGRRRDQDRAPERGARPRGRWVPEQLSGVSRGSGARARDIRAARRTGRSSSGW